MRPQLVGVYVFVVSFHVLLGSISYATTPANSADISAIEILDRWQAACDSIWSYDVLLTTKHQTRSKTSLEFIGSFETRQRFKLGKWRVDHRGETRTIASSNDKMEWSANDELSALAWNGERVHKLNSAQNQGDIVPLERLNKALRKGPLLHEAFSSEFYGARYTDMIRPRKPLEISSTQDGLYEIVAPALQGGGQVAWPSQYLKVVIDKFKGYMPIRIERFSSPPGKVAPNMVIENTVVEVMKGIWLPTHSVKQLFKAGESDPLTVIETDVNVEKSKFNLEIDSAVFDLEFPIGMVVHDHKNNQTFIARAQDARDYEAYQQLVKETIKAQRNAATPLRGAPFNTWLLIVNVTIILLLCVLMWRKWRLNTSS